MGYRSIISLMPKTAPVDADAQAFLTAAGITDPTISGAINTLVVQMKADNIWTKMKAIYPMVGGTASTHKFNLKDPRDLDAAFRLSFSGGWTHSANGALPNGTNANANTFLNGRSILNRISNHLSFYSRTLDSGGNRVDICAYDGNSTLLCCDYNASSGGTTYRSHSVATGIVILKASTVATGFFIGSRTTQTMFKGYKNGVQNGINTTSESTLCPNDNFYISSIGGSTYTGQYSDKQCAFASVGDGLTDTEADNFYLAVQTFQTTLNRQV